MYGSIISRHAHLFWIPLFPVSKKGYAVCTHCKQTLDEQRMPVNYREAVGALKSKAKTPVWQFSGLIILGIVVVVPMLIALIAQFTHKAS